jgi:hypothetical protein
MANLSLPRRRLVALVASLMIVSSLVFSETHAFVSKAPLSTPTISRNHERQPPTRTVFSRRWCNGTPVNGSQTKAAVSKTSVNLALVGSLVSWFVVSWEALMLPHPNPAVAAILCLRHDILTFSQAIAFPFPVMTAAYLALGQNNGQDETLHRRLLLGIASMSLWTMAGVFFCKTFSRGFELFSTPTRYIIAAVQGAIAAWAITSWKRSIRGSSSFWLSRLIRGSVGSVMALFHQEGGAAVVMDNPEQDNDESNNNIALYSFSAMGLLILAAMPQLVGFPTATIPTILGKRFSRAASGITFLGSVLVYCVRDHAMSSPLSSPSSLPSTINGDDTLMYPPQKAIGTLRNGLAWGALGHLFLVVGKIVGIDGGGLLLPGNGLWEYYPSMVNASRAATCLMLVTYTTLAFVCSSSTRQMNE